MGGTLMTTCRNALAIGVALAGLVTPVFASGYSELNSGISACSRGDDDLAIQQLTLALAAPDLSARFLPVAHFDRGRAYGAEGKMREAAADLDAALGLRSGWYEALMFRGIARDKLGDRSGAEADFAAAMAIRPDLVNAYYARGELYEEEERYQDALNDDSRIIALDPDSSDALIKRAATYELAGQFDPALKDAEKARTMTGDKHAYDLQMGIIQWALGDSDDASDEFDHGPSDPEAQLYANLWKVIAAKFSDDSLKDFGKFTAGVDLSKWPGPIASFYLGKISLDQLRLSQDGKTPALTLGHKCEVDFYGAEALLSRSDANGARPLLQAGLVDCPIDFVERPAIKLELSRLGAVHAPN
jgi:lipoprotein NlpI